MRLLRPNRAETRPAGRVVGRRRRWAALAVLWAALAVGCAQVPPGPPAVPAPTSEASHLAVPPTPGVPLTVTVMSYNILGGLAPSNWYPKIDPVELDPVVRAPLIVEKITHAAPDVVGFQEYPADAPVTGRIETALPGYRWLHGPGEHAIAVNTDRFEVLENGAQQISSRGALGPVFDRYADWVHLRDKADGRTLWFLNVHAHPKQTPTFAKVRSAAITELVDLIARLDPGYREPLVMVGDFNARSGEKRPVYRDHLTKLAAAGLVDAATVARADTSDVPGARSLNQMGDTVDGVSVPKVVARGGHIDYVWVPTGATVDSWGVLSGPGVEWRKIRGQRVPVWTGIVASDHSPVVAKVLFEADAKNR
ncbi:endonuclease/exonuclease/phosphatase family protein [Propionicimonas paludicola]|uniref:Endonuclease/exonuclease/phosphatase family protein n=1 Tax=Propionicimonas paludicola TaxID=185243 RepID=A0A2A9CRT8_9ACTN|nr:endonuclease/exonuclease/phosphatase family protein [Propionicimonas paludicola]PFG16911.1 endonuclease/exonuclease/phosphatase family protein [Propionicimonas paludicola]